MKRVTLVKEAAYMAISAHGTQKYDGHPYYYHLEQVVDILKEYGYTEDKYIIAGYLHDVIEDTDVSYNDILGRFGVDIAEIVFAVTDELGRNRRERKVLTLPKTAKNTDAIIIKLADRIANMRGAKKKDMYVKEYETFKTTLYKATMRADEMWKELDSLML